MLRRVHCLSLMLLVALLGPAAFGQDAPQDSLACAAFPYDAPLRSAPDTTYDVVHADVTLDVLEDGTYTGRVALDFRLTRDAVSLALVHRGGAVDSAFFGAASLDFDAPSEDTLRLMLPDTVAAGSLSRMVVYHQGGLGQPAAQVFTALDPLVAWFPSSPNPHDRFTADVRITVPAAWSVAATGVPIGQQTSDEDRMTFRYSSPYELPARRIGFAAGAVDFGTAFAVLPGGRRPTVTWWMPTMRPSDRPRSPQETVSVAGDRIAFYSDWMGFPLPFERYTQLLVDGPPEASAGVVRVPPHVEPDDRAATPYETPAALTKPLLQQWFGTLVSAESWQHVWLEEAFPALLHTLAHSSPDARSAAMTALRDDYLESGDGRPLVWDRWNHPSELLDAPASARGAWVLYMMRRAVGEDTFRQALQLFLTSHQYQTVTTSDWLRAVEQIAERDLSDFADTWIFRGGHPVLGVSYTADGDVLSIRIDQRQAGDDVPSAYELDLTLEIGTLGAVERFDVRVDERHELFELPLSAEPRFVAVDPDGGWLLENRIDQSASAWLAQLRFASTPVSRLAAARALSGTGQDPAILLGLRAALDAESSAEVRSAIVEAIGSLPPTSAAERALSAAFDDPDARVRRTVLRVLADSGSVDAASTLALHAAETDASYAVQAEAVRSLARVGSSNALDVARAALVTPSHDEIIRAAGLDAFGDVSDRAPDEALREGQRYAAVEQPLRLRLAAVHLLGRLAPTSTSAANRLVELLADADPAVVTATVQALRASGHAQLVTEHVDEVSVSGILPSLYCP